jgi:hypothetical protein
MLIKEITDPHELNKLDVEPDDLRHNLYKPALRRYSWDSKQISNLLHRMYKKQPFDPANLNYFKDDILMLDDIMFNHLIKQNITLYHGLKENPIRVWKKYNVPANKSVRVHFPGFISTTDDFDVTRYFAEPDLDQRNILEIDVPAGTPGLSIKNLSTMPKENEILLSRGLDIEIQPNPTQVRTFLGSIVHVWNAKVVGVNPSEIH